MSSHKLEKFSSYIYQCTDSVDVVLMGIHAVAAWVYDLTPIESQTHMTGTLY